MPHNEDELNRELEALKEDTRDRLSGIIDNLKSDLAAQEEARKEAEKKAREAEKKYDAAKELQKEEYSVVIQEIFGEPKEDLIRKITKYSIGGIVMTLIAATLSLFFTNFWQSENTRLLSAAIENSHHILEDISLLNADEGTLEIVGHFRREEEEFRSYRPVGLLARAYKIKPVDSDNFPFYYYQYRAAFRMLGLDDIPTIEDLQRWDVEAHHLYSEWHESVSDLEDGVVPRDHRARYWDSFRSRGDETRYLFWFSGDDVTFSGISRAVLDRRDAFGTQLKKNEEMPL